MSDTADACVSCGGSDFADRRAYRTDTRPGREIFRGARVVECRGCHLIQCRPMPDPDTLASYYADQYRQYGLGGADVANLEEFPRDNLFT